MKNFKYFISASLMLVVSSLVSAGELLITNNSSDLFVCKIKGMSVAIGGGSSFLAVPKPNDTINKVSCNGLEVQSLGLSEYSSNAFITLNGRQTRTLNVALYPEIPTLPDTDFSTLMYDLINRFQMENPEILLNLRLDKNMDIYSNEALQEHLGSSGFDVMELDFLFLGYLVDNDLIAPLQNYDTSNMLATALEIATINGTLWGLPSWLCTDFIFSYNEAIRSIESAKMLRLFLRGEPAEQIHYAGMLSDTWGVTSFYISSYWQTYPGRTIEQAISMPPDPLAIENMYQLTPSCDFNGTNDCINGVFNGDVPQQLFADLDASSTSGYGEASFYIKLFEPQSPVSRPLYAQPLPWGDELRPLLYADAFVASKENCSAAPCNSDSRKFLTFMSRDSVKNMYAFSQDLPAKSPFRRMLSSTKSFYSQQAVIDDMLYQQISPVVFNGNPYPTNISGPIQKDIYTQVCASLKAKDDRYNCVPQYDGLLKTGKGSRRRHKSRHR